jgi:gluconokinase
MTPYFIGLDLGTTSTKVIAFDQRGNTLVTTGVAYPTYYPSANYAVQKPETIWEAVKASVRRVLETVEDTYILTGVGCSAAMHTLLPIDAEGNPLSDLMIWSDNRACDIVETILEKEGDIYYNTVGVPLHPMTPFAKLIWASENKVDWWQNATMFVGIKEWILQKITGEYEMDYSIASATGMFNIHKNHWHEASLNRVAITANKLPKLIDTLTVRHCINDELFPTGTPLVIGASDGCLANLGAGAFTDGTIAVTLGTSAAARAVVPKPILDTNQSTFCYYLAPNHYVVGGGSNSGGIVIEWFVKNFADNNYGTFFEWIDSVPAGADGILCLPYLQGERAPIWNSSAQGMFYGLNMRHSRRHLAKAVIESILLNIKQIIETLSNLQQKSFKSVKVGGGSAISPIVLQLLSDVLGINVHITHTSEHSAWGAAVMAMWSLGYIKDFEHLSAHPPVIIFAPQIEDKAFYNKQLERFKKLYQNTKQI